MIGGHMLQVVFQEGEHILAEATPVAPTVTGVGVHDIVQHDEVYFAVVK